MRLIHAMINTIENGMIADGFIEIQGSKIGTIGSMDGIKPGTSDIDLHGAYIMPGFVDAHTCLGLKEDSLRYEGNDWNETGCPIAPQLRAIDGFNPNDRAVRYALTGAVTTVGVAPGNVNLIGGQVAAVKLCPETPWEMCLNNCSGIKMSLGEASKNSNAGPATRMAELAMLREELNKALLAIQHQKGSTDRTALEKLLLGEIPAFIHAQRADDIVSAVRLSQDYGFSCIIVHGADSALAADYLAKAQVPVIVGSLIQTPASEETKNMDIDLPCKLKEKGVSFAITTDHHMSPIQMLGVCAALAYRDGLDEETALKAVTLTPAKFLGVDARVGSIAEGKDADLAVFSGHPFRSHSRLERLYVNGTLQVLPK